MAQDSFAQDAWIRARDRFTEDLSESERSIYHQSSLEMIFYDASAAQKRHEDSSTSRKIVSKLQPLTAAIEQYGEALDVFANAYPLALSPLWGSIRVVLLLAREFGKYFEKLIDMFERIGDLLPQFRAYERLFPNNERLVHLLSTVYVDILKFCSDVKAVFRRGNRSVINIKIFSKLVWKPFDMQFGDRLSKFREHKKNVEKEAELSHMIESAESRAIILANRLQVEREKREQDRIRMLSQLSAVSHEDLHQIQRQAHHPGTGLWILKTQEYVDWRTSHKSAGLCCYGIPGCGKSVLISTCIEDMLKRENESSMTLAYYYCSQADPRSLLKPQILGNLLKQMLFKGALPEQAERELMDTFIKSERTPSDDVLTKYILSAVESSEDLYIILDGLEECDNDTTREILEVLLQFTRCASNRVRILVTCREESFIMNAVKDWSSIHLGETVLQNDMRLFIACSIRSRIEKGDLRVTDSALENEVVDKLAQKAHGMFLWIYFQLIDLCASLSPSQIRNTLDNLPDGLGETYQRILVNISNVPVRAGFARKVFRWLACARRPLHIDELQEAVAFDESDKMWDAEKIPAADLLLQSCQSLVVRDDNNASVRFAHHTVYQYLTTIEEPESDSAIKAETFKFKLEDAELDAATLCVTYLNFSDFETAIVPKSSDLRFKQEGILGPGGPGTIPSMVGIGKPVVDIMYRILCGRVQPIALQLDFAKHLNIQKIAEEPQKTEKYAFKDYIVANWAWHANAAEKMDFGSNLSRLLMGLIMSKTLPFEFRPWGRNRHFGPYGCNSCWIDISRVGELNMTSMIHWVAEHGLCQLLRRMSNENHLNDHQTSVLQMHLMHEKYSNQSMLIACRHGRTEVFKYLEYHQVFDNFSNFCLAASAGGHAELLAYLIDSKFSPRNTLRPKKEIEKFEDDIEGVLRQVLFSAATNGSMSVAEVALRAFERHLDWYGHNLDVHPSLFPGPSIDLFDTSMNRIMRPDGLSGLTPLHLASASGHYDLVCLILKHFTIIDYCDANEGASALYLAAKNGHATVARELVLHGAHAYLEDKSSKTPLIEAARHGHASVVTSLLECGALTKSNGSGNLKALKVAAEYGHISVVEVLLCDALQIETRGNGFVVTPLGLASKNGHQRVVKRLLEEETAVDGEGGIYHPHRFEHQGESLTPLMSAAAYGHTEVVDLLLDHDLNIHLGTNSDITAAALAYRNRHIETLKRLYERGRVEEKSVAHDIIVQLAG